MSAYNAGSDEALEKLGMEKEAFWNLLLTAGRMALPWLARTAGSALGRVGMRGAASMARRAGSALTAPGIKGIAANMAADTAISGVANAFTPSQNQQFQQPPSSFGQGAY